MAEDFYTAYGLGASDKTSGVQDLAGVQALEARTTELKEKTAEVEQLRERVQTLEARLAAIEQALAEKK